MSYAFPAGLGGTTAQAGKSKLFSRWLDIFAVWHIMKVAKGNWLESSFAHQKRTPSECESEGVLFGLTYPCGGCQATCRCSKMLHSLRQTAQTYKRIPSGNTSLPNNVGGQGRKTSIAYFSTKRNRNEHIPPASELLGAFSPPNLRERA